MSRFLRVLVMVMAGVMITPAHSWSQQLPQFSQYIFNGLHINPAYAGYKNEGYIQSTFRNQWVSFPGAPQTLTLTADLSANEGQMGFGVSLLSDQIGPSRTSTGMLTYSYRIKTGKESFLGLGLSAGASQYMIDGSMLDPNDQNDPNLPMGIQAMFTPNVNSGLFFHTDRFYAGLSAFNMVGKRLLEREDIALAFHNFHYYLTLGALLPVSDNVQLKPSVLVKHVKGAPTSYDLNAMFLFMDRIWLGGSLRSNVRVFEDQLQDNLSKRNAVALVMEYFVTPGLRLGYAYDYNLNALNSFRNESHEISLGVYLRSKRENIYNPRWF